MSRDTCPVCQSKLPKGGRCGECGHDHNKQRRAKVIGSKRSHKDQR